VCVPCEKGKAICKKIQELSNLYDDEDPSTAITRKREKTTLPNKYVCMVGKE